MIALNCSVFAHKFYWCSIFVFFFFHGPEVLKSEKKVRRRAFNGGPTKSLKRQIKSYSLVLTDSSRLILVVFILKNHDKESLQLHLAASVSSVSLGVQLQIHNVPWNAAKAVCQPGKDERHLDGSASFLRRTCRKTQSTRMQRFVFVSLMHEHLHVCLESKQQFEIWRRHLLAMFLFCCSWVLCWSFFHIIEAVCWLWTGVSMVGHFLTQQWNKRFGENKYFRQISFQLALRQSQFLWAKWTLCFRYNKIHKNCYKS